MKKLLLALPLLAISTLSNAESSYDAQLKRYKEFKPVTEKIVILSMYVKNTTPSVINSADADKLNNMHMQLNKLDAFCNELGEPLKAKPYQSCASVGSMAHMYFEESLTGDSERSLSAKKTLTDTINECKQERSAEPADNSNLAIVEIE